ncbi:MAG: LolA-related protein, partial [Burkholderiaceae bacterium]
MTLCIAAGIAFAAALQATAPLATADATPEEILQQVARGAVSEVRFTETRTTRLLKAPLTSSGVLRFSPPDRLERETLRPTPEKVVIEGSQVTIERNGTQTVIALTSGSAAALLIQTLRAVLSGDW